MISKQPSIILVEPQLAENVGMTARAMMNCGLYELRLVNPRENHLSEKAIAAIKKPAIRQNGHITESNASSISGSKKLIPIASPAFPLLPFYIPESISYWPAGQ